MPETIELRAFMGLAGLFRERGWHIPLSVSVDEGLTGEELLARLDIPAESVEIIFINGKVYLPKDAAIRPGDRVALVPPGTPGPYRVLLGFVDKK